MKEICFLITACHYQNEFVIHYKINPYTLWCRMVLNQIKDDTKLYMSSAFELAVIARRQHHYSNKTKQSKEAHSLSIKTNMSMQAKFHRAWAYQPIQSLSLPANLSIIKSCTVIHLPITNIPFPSSYKWLRYVNVMLPVGRELINWLWSQAWVENRGNLWKPPTDEIQS